MAIASSRVVLAGIGILAFVMLFPSCTEENGTTSPEPDPVCLLSPDTLTFGDVAVGSSADRSFTITNSGGGVLAGEVSSGCGMFTVIGGGGVYSLEADEFRTVKVRFHPTAIGPAACSIGTGSTCGGVACEASGIDAPPSCEVDPGTLDFGNVAPGQAAMKVFTIRNVGGGRLSGTVRGDCSDFALTGGAHSYDLGPGEADTVTVLYTPTGCGMRSCSISAGAGCPAVTCIGTSEGNGCSLSTAELAFGEVAIGDSADRSFQITNEGCDVLLGSVGEACGDYQVVSGTGPYQLARGQFRTVIVRYTPSTCDTVSCVIETGIAACGTVTCEGSGLGDRCSIAPATADFGPVAVGSFADMSISIRNDGCAPLSGTVAAACGDFTTVAGAGDYSIASGQAHEITIRFQPTSCGEHACSIDLGSAVCGSIPCAGTGAGTGCTVDPASIDFGVVALGDFSDRSFTVFNDGCETVFGRVVESCGDYSIQDGGGEFSLPPGESRTVRTLRMQ